MIRDTLDLPPGDDDGILGGGVDLRDSTSQKQIFPIIFGWNSINIHIAAMELKNGRTKALDLFLLPRIWKNHSYQKNTVETSRWTNSAIKKLQKKISPHLWRWNKHLLGCKSFFCAWVCFSWEQTKIPLDLATAGLFDSLQQPKNAQQLVETVHKNPW